MLVVVFMDSNLGRISNKKGKFSLFFVFVGFRSIKYLYIISYSRIRKPQYDHSLNKLITPTQQKTMTKTIPHTDAGLPKNFAELLLNC